MRPVRPVLRAFRDERLFPSSDLGPVDALGIRQVGGDLSGGGHGSVNILRGKRAPESRTRFP